MAKHNPKKIHYNSGDSKGDILQSRCGQLMAGRDAPYYDRIKEKLTEKIEEVECAQCINLHERDLKVQAAKAPVADDHAAFQDDQDGKPDEA